MNLKNNFVIDVESDGPCPGLFNMISFGLVSLEDVSLNFRGNVYPLVMNDGGIPEARVVSGISWEEQLGYDDSSDVMNEAHEWLMSNSDGGEVTLFSDNIAFDWQWWNYYSHLFIGENIAGHSGRRIGDLYAGHKQDWRMTSKWKNLRKSKHDHDPVNDATGNAEALRQIISEMECAC